MENIKFEHEKYFLTLQGEAVTMKALLTVHGKKFIEVYENSNQYRPDELSELPKDHVIFEEIV